MGQNKLRKYISQIIKEELNTQNEIFGLGKVTEDLSESGGILKVEQAKDGKYYWTFTFKSGKVEKWPNGFATSAEAQKDFIYRSKYLKEGTFNSKREEELNTQNEIFGLGKVTMDDVKKKLENMINGMDANGKSKIQTPMSPASKDSLRDLLDSGKLDNLEPKEINNNIIGYDGRRTASAILGMVRGGDKSGSATGAIFREEKENISESGGTLKVEKEKDGKYYWTFTFKSGKVEKWPNGFATSAEAQKDFMYRSKYLKEGTFNSKREKENIDETWYRMKVLAGVIK